ncbi:MAG: hypothetical protein HZA32_19950 [Opitutae bacterium]|nr:hypothetical protein [Opitutae bacterium]
MAVLVASLLASCASDDRPHRGAPPKPPTPVAGEGMFFGGQLVATVHVGMEFQRPEGGGEGNTRGGREGGGGRRGGGGGMSFGGGAGPMQFGGGPGGGSHGGPRGGGERGGEETRGEFGGGGPRIAPAGGLPLMIHLRLRNTGSAPLEVAAPDFDSPLGNFVVLPAKLTVPPGETAEFTPMTSFVRGDLPDELPVTLALRVGGKTDKQTIVLRPVSRGDTPANDGRDPESRPTRK